MAGIGDALAYAARGWLVFPTKPRAPFQPLTSHGSLDASKDPAKLREWWAKWPTANVAIATGAGSGITVIDVDPRHGGDKVLSDLLDRFGEPFPNTLTAKSGGDGYHYYFRYVPGLATSTGRVGEGIDIRGEGGSITAPASIHKSGSPYVWLNDVELGEFPKFIRALAERMHTKAEEREAERASRESADQFKAKASDKRLSAWGAAVVDNAAAEMRGTGEGRRRNTLNALAYPLFCYAAGGALDGPTVRDRLRDAALATGMTAREVDATLKGAMVDASRSPRFPELEDRPTYYGTNGHQEPPPADGVPSRSLNGKDHDAPVLPALRTPRGVLADIKRREWILGRTFCRGYLSGIVGAGAGGKTTLRLAQYLSIVSGRALTGEDVHARGKVLFLCFEDDEDEIERRVQALMMRFGLDDEEVVGLLKYCLPKGLLLASLDHQGRVVAGPLLGMVRAWNDQERDTTGSGFDLFGFDPLAGAHALPENDNLAMQSLSDLLSTLAEQCGAAVDFTHHTRKGPGEAGDVDRSRGGGGLTNRARVVQTLTTMTKEEAQANGVDERDRRDYFRIDNGKINIAPAGEERWYHLAGQTIRSGDSVQVVEPWNARRIWESVSAATAATIIDEIGRGVLGADGKPNGQRYSNSSKAEDRHGWRVVQSHLKDHTEAQCRVILSTWVRSGALKAEGYVDPIQRKPRIGLVAIAANRPTAPLPSVEEDDPI